MPSISNSLCEKVINPELKDTNQSPSLNQGKKFQNSLEKEGFDNMNVDEDSLYELSYQTNKVINENNFSTDQPIINNLRNEYKNTLKEYEDLSLNFNIPVYVNN